MNIRISYKVRSLIYRVAVIALIGDIGSAIGVRAGVNKVQVRNTAR